MHVLYERVTVTHSYLKAIINNGIRKCEITQFWKNFIFQYFTLITLRNYWISYTRKTVLYLKKKKQQWKLAKHLKHDDFVVIMTLSKPLQYQINTVPDINSVWNFTSWKYFRFIDRNTVTRLRFVRSKNEKRAFKKKKKNKRSAEKIIRDPTSVKRNGNGRLFRDAFSVRIIVIFHGGQKPRIVVGDEGVGGVTPGNLDNVRISRMNPILATIPRDNVPESVCDLKT